MATYSQNINEKQILAIAKKYGKYEQPIANEYVLHFYKKPDGLSITVFKSGKLVVQGTEKLLEAFGVPQNKEEKVKKEEPKKVVIKPAKYDGMIGCDEVGTGDYFGPIVTCACYVDNKNLDAIKLLKVNDSKKLTDQAILDMVKPLSKLVKYSIQVCMPETYNKMWNDVKNIKAIIAICHNNGVLDLSKKLRNKNYKVVLDEFVNPKSYNKYLFQAGVEIANIDISIPKAESKYISVACASVLARAMFLDIMNQLSKQAKVELPLGATRKEAITQAGKTILKQKKNLANFAKLDFESITDLINK